MKKVSFLIVVLICALTHAHAQKKISYKKLVPKSLKAFRFGMPLEKFQAEQPQRKASDDMSFRHVFEIPKPVPGIKELTIYFDADGKKPLYELIIEFSEKIEKEAFVSKKYGQPNNGREWKWTLPDGLKARAWAFDNTIVVTVLYPGTEHGE
jgi:hypothetical protein